MLNDVEGVVVSGVVWRPHDETLMGFTNRAGPPKNSGLSALRQFGRLFPACFAKPLVGVSMCGRQTTPETTVILMVSI